MNWSLHLLAFWSLLIFGSQAPRSRSLKNPCNFVLLLLGLAPFPSLFSVVTGDGEGLASACDCFCSFFPHEGWMGLTCGPSSRGVPACLAMELFPLESAPALGCAALRPFPAFSLVAPHFRDWLCFFKRWLSYPINHVVKNGGFLGNGVAVWRHSIA